MLRLRARAKKAQARGYEVPLLCEPSIRRAVRHALRGRSTDLSVIAYQEIPTDMLMEPVAVIRPEELAGASTVPPCSSRRTAARRDRSDRNRTAGRPGCAYEGSPARGRVGTPATGTTAGSETATKSRRERERFGKTVDPPQDRTP